MSRLTTPILVVLLVTTLSGCIAASPDDADGNGNTDAGDAGSTPATPAGPYEGTVAMNQVYTESWSGPTTLDDTITIDRDYDYLIYQFSQAGETLGPPTFTTPDGQRMDEGRLRSTAGTITISRTLQGHAGEARVESNGPLQGAGSITIMGVDNVPPMALFAMGWSGQNVDTGIVPMFGGQTRFYVPVGLETLRLSIAGSGEAAPGIRIISPDGSEAASLDTMAGADSASTEVPSQDGIWTISVDGPAAGAFSVTVTGIPT